MSMLAAPHYVDRLDRLRKICKRTAGQPHAEELTALIMRAKFDGSPKELAAGIGCSADEFIHRCQSGNQRLRQDPAFHANFHHIRSQS